MKNLVRYGATLPPAIRLREIEFRLETSNPNREPKHTAKTLILMKDLISFAHALSDDTRWRIIRLVMDDAMCVCELADIMDMPQSSVSSHVQVIRKAGLLESEKCGKWAYFRVEDKYLDVLETLAKTFSGSSGSVCRSDDAKAVKRLKERDDSCCQGPKRLAGSRNNK